MVDVVWVSVEDVDVVVSVVLFIVGVLVWMPRVVAVGASVVLVLVGLVVVLTVVSDGVAAVVKDALLAVVVDAFVVAVVCVGVGTGVVCLPQPLSSSASANPKQKIRCFKEIVLSLGDG